MKIRITVDCTPLEARGFLGLPDVSPLHDIYLEKAKNLIEQGITADHVADLMKNWSQLGGVGMALAQQLFSQFDGPSEGKRPGG